MSSQAATTTESSDTGPIGPVAVFALVFVLGFAPLMRGGNRHAAMLVLEAGSLVFLAAVLARAAFPKRVTARGVLLGILLASPLWLAAIYLTPLPASTWAATPGRAAYPQVLAQAGVPVGDSFPLSLVPDATLVSVFAGIPVAAAFLAGLWLQASRVNLVLGTVAVLGFFEVVLGLLQAGTGTASTLYFGAIAAGSGRPLGSFANPNHFANYLALALTAYIWLGWSRWKDARDAAVAPHAFLSARRHLMIWAAGGVLLAIGILMSRSRGATLAGLFAASCAIVLVVVSSSRRASLRRTLLIVAVGVVAALAVVGFDLALSRFDPEDVRGAASTRNLLASSTMEGAAAFWPWGAGWGTFETVYPRFQPSAIVGLAGSAHQDYAQLLFEGGVFAVLLMAVFAWLAAERAVQLVRAARRRGRLRRTEMLSAVCGLGLGGFLLHSLVEFNMHIPANATVAALLAGIYLRPLERDENTDD